MRKILQVLLYASIVSLVVYLFKKDYLNINVPPRPLLFALSVILLLAGYLADAMAWKTILSAEGTNVSFKDAYCGSGKYVFAKYIPGKIWILLGKAGYINLRYSTPVVLTGAFAFQYQVISILLVSILGSGLIYKIDPFLFYASLLIVVFIAVYFFLFQGKALRMISGIIGYFSGKRTDFPVIKNAITIKVMVFSLINWVIWAAAFLLFLYSVCSREMIPVEAGLIFPVSSVIGIIVLIAPGGLGFREGAMVAGLLIFGFPAAEAASLAVLSRLWSLAGEFLNFSSSVIWLKIKH